MNEKPDIIWIIVIIVEVKIVNINEWYQKGTEAWKVGSVRNLNNQLFMVFPLTCVCEVMNVQTQEVLSMEILPPAWD